MSSPGPISRLLVTLDRICDYIPLLSTVSNSVDLFQRVVMYIQSSEPTNHYRKYVHEKDITRSLILLVPVVGNIAVGILDVKKRKTHMQSEPQLVRDTEGNIKVAETIAHRLCAVLGIYTQAELADPNCSQTQPFPSAQFRTEDKYLLITFPASLCTARSIEQTMKPLLLQDFAAFDEMSTSGEILSKKFLIDNPAIKKFAQETLGLKSEEFATALNKILPP